MILSFDCKDTQELFESERNRRFSNIARVALRKLIALSAAERLEDLAVPPGNKLKALEGRWQGPAFDSDQ